MSTFPSEQAPAVLTRPTVRVLLVLPPDFAAPPDHLVHRFAPLGPAVVAAAVAPIGMRFVAADLAAIVHRAPLHEGADVFDDGDSLEAYLAGEERPAVAAAMDDLLSRLEPLRSECDLVAISIDRGSQVHVAALLAYDLKRRWRALVIVGGIATDNLRALLGRTGAIAADVVTRASTPDQLRAVFAAVAELPRDRRGPALDPNTDVVQLIRGGLRKAPSAEGWPMPDFGIYDLSLYRRPLLEPTQGGDHPEGRALGSHLVLPYHFAFECQFSCAFCQTGGNQESKPIDQVVRELATLAERWEVRDFAFFNAQSNLLAPALSRALIAARLDLRWSDSYRVRPREPGDLELMARAGCAALTVGVESASDRVLKAMVKGNRAEHATEMIREAHACDVLLRVNILTCFPGEAEEDLAMTCAWVEEHARCIDDLAPSSFYLTADSPLGRHPERYGITIRGPRVLRGETRFRKSPDTLAYDEVGGMPWEEREPLLAESEDRVREAWLRGRGDRRGLGAIAPSTMLGLRRHFATKEAIYGSLLRFRAGVHDDAADARARSEGAIEPASPPLEPRLVGPPGASRGAVQRLAVVLREAWPSLRSRFRAGQQVYCLVAAHRDALVFRGSVRRARAGRGSLESFTAEEVLWARGEGLASESRRLEGRVTARGLEIAAPEAREGEGRAMGLEGRQFELLSFVVEESAAAG